MRSSNGGGQTNTAIRSIDIADVALPNGYKIDAVATGFTFPSAITFDEAGDLYVIETGYSYGEVFLNPKLIKLNADGTQKVIATGEKNGPWTNVAYHQGNFYVSEGGQMEGGKILKITPQGQIITLVDSLPGFGDHHTNAALVGPDGYLYFGQGSATNSGVVGNDNYDFGWLKRFPQFHDIPCKDITLTGQNFTTDNILTAQKGDKATTGAYMPYGKSTTDGQVIRGSVPCCGAVMRMPLNGGKLEVVAWGFRNPYGMAFAPDGSLYVSENSYDVRGSRPVWGTADYLWKVESGKWYGWPDFAGGHPIEHHKVPKEEDPKPLLKNYPNEPPHPVATLGVHSSANGFDFSRNANFGHVGEVFIAEFGDQAPGVGKVMSPVGYKVCRVDVNTGIVHEFVANKGKKNGPASWLHSGGLERPVSVKFNPDGTALYIVDFGILNMSETGASPKQKTGVIWKVTRTK